MTPALVAVIATLVLVTVLVITSVSHKRTASAPHTDASEDWLRAARAALRDGHWISGRLADEGDRSPADLPDVLVDDIVAEMTDFRARIAAVSATAPTAMDTRVCREVGVRAHALSDVYEREVRLREVFGGEDRSALTGDTLQEPARRLEDFVAALRDLETHVELL